MTLRYGSVSMDEINRMLIAEGKPPLIVEELRAAFGTDASAGQVAATLRLAERMQALTLEDQQRVRQRTLTGVTWEKAIQAAEQDWEHEALRPWSSHHGPADPVRLANINLPTPNKPKGRRLTRRQRGRR